MHLCITSAHSNHHKSHKNFTTMKKQKSQSLSNYILIFLFLSGASILIATLSVYLTYFGDFQVIADGEKWGQFGDFLGGTANPLLSFLTFSALLITIFQQNKQLAISNSELENSREELILTRDELRKTAEAATKQAEHLERESRLSELLGLIEKIAVRTNRNFNENILDEELSLHRALSNYHSSIQTSETALLIKHYNKENSKTRRTIKWIASDLERLCDLIKNYNAIKENYTSPLPKFYQKEFGELVNMLHDHDMISKEIYIFFCLEGE